MLSVVVQVPVYKLSSRTRIRKRVMKSLDDGRGEFASTIQMNLTDGVEIDNI
jgi:hypothetical protein